MRLSNRCACLLTLLTLQLLSMQPSFGQVDVTDVPPPVKSIEANTAQDKSGVVQPIDVSPVGFQQVAGVLSKYCAGCHNDTDREGEFSVSSYTALMAGAEEGPVIIASDVSHSRLLQLLTRQIEPVMPPEGEPQPAAHEIELLRRWIEQGAHGDDSRLPSGLSLDAPQLPTAPARFHHVGAACGVAVDTYAVGMLGKVQLRDRGTAAPRWTTGGLAGKVTALRLSPDGQCLVVGCGIAGVGGEALLLDVTDGRIVQRVVGHDDAIYCAALAPDGKTLATGSYDRRIILWDIPSGTKLRELTGHNGAIYDLDFDSQGELLATASADQTVKLWRVDTGQRLDTLGQPEGEQRCVRFSPDGQTLVAAGADKQIRQWKVVSRTEPAINPMLLARFAHEAEIVQLAYSDSNHLISCSTDNTVKLWEAESITGLGTLATLSDLPVGLCLAPAATGPSSVVLLDGRHVTWSSATPPTPQASRHQSAALFGTAAIAERPPRPVLAPPGRQLEPVAVAELEPNDHPAQATPLVLSGMRPTTVSGGVASRPEGQADQDLWRFNATEGQSWIFEVAAARTGSALDSRIDILDAAGQPVVRTRLQATRESYFTFRGKDSSTSDDFRLHKWEDMELDEYLYANGEVNRLWLYPRGPDSGFKVYPGAGKRHAFFDTTPLAHALGEPTYIVRELSPQESPLPNGLPVFPILYENDDDAQTRLGKDSRLTFVAPASGEYLLRIRDARGFGGTDFRYQLTIRQPQPDFELKLADTQMSLPAESGREWSAEVTRIDGLDGPIAIHLQGIPDGVLATNPLIIEAGQQSASGTLFVTAQARQQLGQQQQFSIQLTASAQVAGQRIERQLNDQLMVTLVDKPEVQLRLVAADAPEQELEELTIRPGQTISARVTIKRNGTDSRVELGKEDAGRNLPHGAFVDNIGLNGLLIVEGQTEREFFITAAPKVAPGRRQFHLKSGTAGKPTSRPVWLNVLD